MSRRSRVVSEYEVLLSHNFLKNISFDGSHNDTRLAIFKQRGLGQLKFRTKTASQSRSRNVEEEEEAANKKQVSFVEHVDVNELSPDELLSSPAVNIPTLELQVPNHSMSLSPSISPNPIAIETCVSLDGSLDSGQTSFNRQSLMRTSSCASKGRKRSDRLGDSNESLNFLKKLHHFFHSLDKSGFDKLTDRKRAETTTRERQISESSSGDANALRPFEFDNSHSEVSYMQMLNAGDAMKREEDVINCEESPDVDFIQQYNPHLLDDPTLKCSTEKATICMHSFSSTTLDYVSPSALKRETNDRFRSSFPLVELTYSKFLSIKREMLLVSRETGVDLLTLSQAFVYFEKIVLKALVSKTNRKHIAGCCLIVAAKLNDFRGEQLQNLLDRVEFFFRCNRKELLSLELPVVFALQFNLYPPNWEILPHYHKLVWTA